MLFAWNSVTYVKRYWLAVIEGCSRWPFFEKKNNLKMKGSLC